MSLTTPRAFSSFPSTRAKDSPDYPLQALAACVAGLLACGPFTSSALELGEATMRSALGQSLAVQIPYRLADGEQLKSACIGLSPASAVDEGLPIYAPASRIAVTPTHIEIFGQTRVVEPLIGLTLDIHCDTVPHFVRSYQLFVDPSERMPTALDGDTRLVAAAPTRAQAIETPATQPRASAQKPAVAQRDSEQQSADAPVTSGANTSPRARGQDGGAVAQGQTYLVIAGDTLSGIAARVSDRAGTIHETAEAIFAANPQAFRRGNRDLLEAGRSITIPVLTDGAAVPAPATTTAPAAIEEAKAPAATPASAISEAPVDSAALDPVAVSPAAERASDVQRLPIEPATVVGTAEPIAATPSVSLLQAEVTPQPAPVDAAARAAPAPPSGGNSPWLSMLAAFGAGALLSAAVLLRRRTRETRSEQQPAAQAQARPRLATSPTAGLEVIESRLSSTASNRLPSLRQQAASVDSTATVRMLRPKPAAAPLSRSLPAVAAPAKDPIEEALPTLSQVDLDLLNEDYETEHTARQRSSEALREALENLKESESDGDATIESSALDDSGIDTIRNRA